MKKIILLLSCIILLSNSCKKEELPYYPVPGEMKEYFSAAPGSYWIYRNDNTGELDSTYVTAYSDDENNMDIAGLRREMIGVEFHSSYLSKFIMTYANSINSLNLTSKITDGGNTGIAYVYDWPPYSDHKIDSTQLFTSEKISRDSVNGIIYNNIIYSRLDRVMTGNLKMGPSYYSREIWFAPSTGIIKYYEHFGNNDFRFSLVRKKIITP